MSAHSFSPPFGYFLVMKGMEEEIDNYRKIIDISGEQQVALEEGNIDLLNKLINEKGRLITQIDKIEQKISPARNSLRGKVESLPSEILVKLRKIHGELQITMDEVRHKDNQALAFAMEVTENMRNRISTLKRDSKLVSRSYLYKNKDEKPIPRFFDKMG